MFYTGNYERYATKVLMIVWRHFIKMGFIHLIFYYERSLFFFNIGFYSEYNLKNKLKKKVI